MRTVGRSLVVGWLLIALLLLGMDGRLLVFGAWAAPVSLLGLCIRALARQQRAPSIADRSRLPRLPERYRVADDLQLPLDLVIAVAEFDAERWE